MDVEPQGAVRVIARCGGHLRSAWVALRELTVKTFPWFDFSSRPTVRERLHRALSWATFWVIVGVVEGVGWVETLQWGGGMGALYGFLSRAGVRTTWWEILTWRHYHFWRHPPERL